MQFHKPKRLCLILCCSGICTVLALGQVACNAGSDPQGDGNGDDTADDDNDADDDGQGDDDDDTSDEEGDDDASDEDDDDTSDEDDDDTSDEDDDDASDDDDDDDDTDTGTDTGDDDDDNDDDQGFACDEPDPGFEPFEKGASPPHYENTTVGGAPINLCDLSGKPILVSYGARW